MRFLSKVCIEFRNPANRDQIFKVTGNDRLVLLDAPQWIKEDPMFAWSLRDGSIEVVDTAFKQKSLENDPMNGAGADGKTLKEDAIKAEAQEIAAEMATELGIPAETSEEEAPKKTTRRKKSE